MILTILTSVIVASDWENLDLNNFKLASSVSSPERQPSSQTSTNSWCGTYEKDTPIKNGEYEYEKWIDALTAYLKEYYTDFTIGKIETKGHMNSGVNHDEIYTIALKDTQDNESYLIAITYKSDKRESLMTEDKCPQSPKFELHRQNTPFTPTNLQEHKQKMEKSGIVGRLGRIKKTWGKAYAYANIGFYQKNTQLVGSLINDYATTTQVKFEATVVPAVNNCAKLMMTIREEQKESDSPQHGHGDGHPGNFLWDPETGQIFAIDHWFRGGDTNGTDWYEFVSRLGQSRLSKWEESLDQRLLLLTRNTAITKDVFNKYKEHLSLFLEYRLVRTVNTFMDTFRNLCPNKQPPENFEETRQTVLESILHRKPLPQLEPQHPDETEFAKTYNFYLDPASDITPQDNTDTTTRNLIGEFDLTEASQKA